MSNASMRNPRCGMVPPEEMREFDTRVKKILDGEEPTYVCELKIDGLKIVLTYEPVIYAMLPEARYTGTYSVPLTKIPKSRFRRKVKDENDLKSVWYGPREVNVNLKSKYLN